MENKNISVEQAINICKGNLIQSGKISIITKYSCDTRKMEKGDLFVALKSETNNEVENIKKAFEQGAMGCITECKIPSEILEANKDKLVIQVEDIVKAVQELAIYKRNLYKIPVVAITGSVGKTSTKDMIASVLSRKYNVYKTQGNYNNHIGVPLTILNWEENTEAAVIEMGMNHLKEISVLTNLAKPTIAVITNVGTAHIGNLGSRENILKAKLEILEGLQENGKVFFNNDNDLLHTCSVKEHKTITYGIREKSDYQAENIVIKEECSEYTVNIKNIKYTIHVPVAGEHFIYNSLCAIAIGTELNIEPSKIIEGIKSFKLTEKRNEIKEVNDLKMINDYYNASYDSMKASLQVLSNIECTRKIAILGDMLELGDFSEELHKKVGEEVIKYKIDILITIGTLAKDIAKEAEKLGLKETYSYNTNQECINELHKFIKKHDCVLLKASNRMNFGEISEYIQGENLWKK